MIERIPDLVNADENLVRRGRFLSTTFLWRSATRAIW